MSHVIKDFMNFVWEAWPLLVIAGCLGTMMFQVAMRA